MDRISESSRECIERLISEGKNIGDAVANAERVWQQHLQSAITMPGGEQIAVGIVKASFNWDDPERDILRLFVEPTPSLWEIDPDDEYQVLVLRVLDENEEMTDGIAGVEMIDFLHFERWDDLPELPMLWQIPGWEPLPLMDVLKRGQALLREEAGLVAREQVRAS